MEGARSIRDRIPRGGYLGLGFLFVVLGFVGYVLPVMPGTIFLILALGCFKRSSIKFERWLLNNRLFGPTLQMWDESRSISRRAKTLAVSMIVASFSVSIYLLRYRLSVAITLGVIGLAVIVYRLTLPESGVRNPIKQFRVNETP